MEYNCFDWKPATLSAAERILSETFETPVTLGSANALWDAPDNCKRNVLRCEIFAQSGVAPKTVILKRIASPRVSYHAGDIQPDTISWRHGTEWAACRLLALVDGGSALFPRCYGGDRDEALLVMEDLGEGPTVATILKGDDSAQAEQALIGYAVTLGRMHASTFSRETDYNRIRSEIGLPAITSREDDVSSVRRHEEKFRELMGSIGISISAAADIEMAEVLYSLADAGPFLALTHGDPNPVNDLFNNGIVHLYDFEYSGFRHMLMDGVVNRHLFHWVRYRLPDAMLAQFEARYRQELARVCPEAEDEKVYRLELMRARSVWMLVTLNSLLERAATEDGYEEERSGYDGVAAPTLRQRALILLDRFAVDAAAYRCLPAMAELSIRLSTTLKRLWRIETIALPIYPAFRSNQ